MVTLGREKQLFSEHYGQGRIRGRWGGGGNITVFKKRVCVWGWGRILYFVFTLYILNWV